MTIPVQSKDDRLSRTCGEVVGPLVHALEDLVEMLDRITPEQYVAASNAMFSNASIAGHIRHTLDHVRAVTSLTGTNASKAGVVLDYDARERGTTVETDVREAQRETRRLVGALRMISDVPLNQGVRVSIVVSRESARVLVDSTMGRELAFALSHTVHHAAMIRSIAVLMSIRVSDHIGVAPATLAHQDARGCAR